jgi:quinoprotein glucose dehydrogenase
MVREFAPQEGTPYAMTREPILSPFFLPCNPPPWGTLAAVSLETGERLWESPLGTLPDRVPIPVPIDFGLPNLGGAMVTAGGLVFIGAAMDGYLRAYDAKTGEELWKDRLPAGGNATPMTYRLGPSRRQFVVIAAGGHGKLGTRRGDFLVAYALPASK